MSDELEPLVTQCPNCDTRFRVNEAQLQAAVGKVRCGACLTVFDGTSYLLLDGELLPGEAEDVDALLDEIDAQEQDLTQPAEDFGFDPAPAVDVSPSLPELEDRVDGGDLELAELEAQLLAELKGEPAPEVVRSDLPNLGEADAFASLIEANEHVDHSGVDEFPDGVDVSPDFSDGAEVSGDEGEPLSTAGEVEPVLDADESLSSEEEEPWLQVPQPQTAPGVTLTPELFEEEEPPKRSWITKVVLVLAIIALPVQLLWYQFEDWSKLDSLRPFYAQACNVLGCELPVRRDVGLISARNSVLRDHPELLGALVYDALLINQAPFEQPYPLVELTLTTVRGQLVASRRFKPNEYLSGDVAAAQMMSPFTPIHISLAIKDPGEAPLSFKVRFLPYY